MKYRYSLDQTFTKHEAVDFLKETALKHNIIAYGYYKGNGKTETEILTFDGPKHKKILDMKINYKKHLTDI